VIVYISPLSTFFFLSGLNHTLEIFILLEVQRRQQRALILCAHTPLPQALNPLLYDSQLHMLCGVRTSDGWTPPLKPEP
jgi:hypothetical protein